MGVGPLLSLSGIGREVGWGGLLFEAGRLLTFSSAEHEVKDSRRSGMYQSCLF